jgi:hypothetical protein
MLSEAHASPAPTRTTESGDGDDGDQTCATHFCSTATKRPGPPCHPEAQQAALGAYGAYIQALQEAGALVGSDWLKPTATATTLTLAGGRRVQDSPYADTKEQLGGLFLIDVPDLDAAIAWAERCRAAQHGCVEIRPSNMT